VNAATLDPAVELALRRSLVGEVPGFVRAIIADQRMDRVRITVFCLPTIRDAWRGEFEQEIESEYEQNLPADGRPGLEFLFVGEDQFRIEGPVCILHSRP
jgi:hypothetical protein